MKTFIHKFLKRGGTISLAIVLITSAVMLMCTAFNESSPWEKASVKVLKYYPNPATSYINFEFSPETDKSYSLLIFSFIGKKMVEMPVENNKIVVPLTGYYRGIYVFQLKDKTGRIVETGRFQVIQ